MSARSGKKSLAIATAALSVATVTTAGATRAAYAAMPPAAPVTMQVPLAAGTQDFPLPSGDHVVVTKAAGGTSSMTLDARGEQVPAIKFFTADGHAYVVPTSAIRANSALRLRDYGVPALASPKTVTPTATATRTLHLQVTDQTGQPAQHALVFLVNVDDALLYNAGIQVVGGVADVTVPVGNYAMFTVFGGSTPDNTAGQRIVVDDDLAIAAGDGTPLTLTADARSATSQIGVATPRPTTTDLEVATFTRTDVGGRASVVQVDATGSMWVNPQPEARVGTLGYQLVWGGEGPGDAPDPYRYDLMFPTVDSIAADQIRAVDPSRLETQHHSFDTDPGLLGQEGRYVVSFLLPDGGGSGRERYSPEPGRLTEYLGAPIDGASWAEDYDPAMPSAAIPGLVDFSPRSLQVVPGRQIWRRWAHGPLTPQVGQASGPTYCQACFDGSTLGVGFVPVVDSEPDTEGWGFGAPGLLVNHITAYRDGTQIADGATNYLSLPNPQQPGSYRLVYDQDLTKFGLTQGAITHTDLTFPFDPASGAALPAQDECPVQQPGATTPCRILPLLNLNYQLATDATGTSPSPAQSLNLTVGHQMLDGQGSSAAITGATVSVSYDAGRTWNPATLLPAGGGHYTALWIDPVPSGTKPWLKVTATDALGGSISQTIENAYTIG